MDFVHLAWELDSREVVFCSVNLRWVGGATQPRELNAALSVRVNPQSGGTRPRELNVMEESEARKRFGDSLVIASLGVLVKD